MRLVAFSIALALATSAFGQQKPEVGPRDTGSDLLWKKLESRVDEIATKLDGVMVVVSDNAAANVLIDRVGMQNVNATMRSLGLTKTVLRRKMMDIAAARRGDENVATPQEMARLLEMIYKGKALSKELTGELIKRLKTLKKDSYLSYELPAGVDLADKPGTLDGVW